MGAVNSLFYSRGDLVFLLNDFGYFWRRLLRLSLSILFMMTIFRIILIVRTPIHWSDSISKATWLWSLVVGMRFDFLVWCFFLVPVYFLSMPLSINLGTRTIRILTKIYLVSVWMLISVLELIDGQHYVRQMKRLRYGSYDALFSTDWVEACGRAFRQGTMTSFLFLCVFLLGFLAIMQTSTRQMNTRASTYGITRGLILWNIFWPFLILISGARGTFSPHHLAYEDSQLTEVESFNELILNACWTFDK